jgi:histidinol phosphatase-like PHP family hydrolase
MSWTKIHGEELQRLQERLELAQQSTSLEASTLRTPFYQNGELVRMHDGTGASLILSAAAHRSGRQARVRNAVADADRYAAAVGGRPPCTRLAQASRRRYHDNAADSTSS